MNEIICDLLAVEERAAFATASGSEMHLRLQRVSLDAPYSGDAELRDRIISFGKDLVRFFRAPARAELPVAGYINGRFISRRMDRVIIDNIAHTVDILDYKTDIDRTSRRDKYMAQVGEYITLMRRIYPDYAVCGYILWLHDWTLEKVDIA